MKRASITEFRAKCFALLRQVQRAKKPILITRFGKPLAEIVPVSPKRKIDWIGSMKGSMEIPGDIVSPACEEGDWEALRD